MESPAPPPTPPIPFPIPNPPPAAPVSSASNPLTPSQPDTALPTTSRGQRRSYGAVADPAVSLYEMLHIDPHCSPDEVEAGLRAAQRWWNAQQANPKYRRQAGEALARLREARELLLDPIRRQEYDRHHQQFRQSLRARRWQPVRDLLDVLIEGDACTHEQQKLLERFATKRGLSPDEIDDLIGEECLQRGLTLLPPTQANSRTPALTAPTLHLPHRWIITAMGLSLLGILALPFYGLSRSAVLLAFPFFNNLRLVMHDIVPRPEEAHHNPINGWDWFVGIAVLGGATITALVDLSTSPLLALGISTASLTWLAWLGIFFSHQRHIEHNTPVPQLPPSTDRTETQDI